MSRALAVERAAAKAAVKEAREAVTAAITAAAKAATQAAAEAVAAEKAAAKAAKAFESKKRLRVVQIAVDQARFSEQALPGEVEAWRQASVPRLLRHGRGGGTVLCTVAGGVGGCGGSSSSAASSSTADGGGGGAAGGVGGADAADSGRPSRSYFLANNWPDAATAEGGYMT